MNKASVCLPALGVLCLRFSVEPVVEALVSRSCLDLGLRHLHCAVSSFSNFSNDDVEETFAKLFLGSSTFTSWLTEYASYLFLVISSPSNKFFLGTLNLLSISLMFYSFLIMARSRQPFKLAVESSTDSG